eukprot:jgi/Tetstr1/440468/TSEL_028794.t1
MNEVLSGHCGCNGTFPCIYCIVETYDERAMSLQQWWSAGISMRNIEELELMTHTVIDSRCPFSKCADRDVTSSSAELTDECGQEAGPSAAALRRMQRALTQALADWALSELNIKLSTTAKAGQSKTCAINIDLKIDLTGETWPRVTPARCGSCSSSSSKITHGCEDSNPTVVEAHATESEQIGSRLLSAYMQVANKKDVTMYIHFSAVHLGQMIRRHVNLGKWCSQELNALHQWMHFFGRHGRKKQKRHAVASILTACTMKAFSARTKVVTAKAAGARARATVKAAAKQAASGVARTKFTWGAQEQAHGAKAR